MGTTQGRLHQGIFKCRGRLVYVHDHTYDVDGRLSNWVTYSYVDKEGNISRKTQGDYDFNQFKPVKQFTTVTKVVKRGRSNQT
jgi:hypothetical protein